MGQGLKFFAGLVVLAIYGPYLLYVWAADATPAWAYHSSLRRVLMLSRDYEPTFFTLMFGVMFTGLVVYGVLAFATGKAHFQKAQRDG